MWLMRSRLGVEGRGSWIQRAESKGARCRLFTHMSRVGNWICYWGGWVWDRWVTVLINWCLWLWHERMHRTWSRLQGGRFMCRQLGLSSWLKEREGVCRRLGLLRHRGPDVGFLVLGVRVHGYRAGKVGGMR